MSSQVGQRVEGRVLNVDAANRKLSLTLKPALLGSKLTAITSPLHVAPGVRAHGVVTGVTVSHPPTHTHTHTHIHTTYQSVRHTYREAWP